jgi:hypothetical protein
MKRVVCLLAVSVMMVALGTTAAFAQDASCADTLACVIGCSGKNADCVLACKQQRSPDAVNQYFYLEACLSAVCPGVPPDAVCVLQAGVGKCKPEYEACVVSGSCQVNCEGKACGDNGCGGSCGDCPPGQSCMNFTCSSCTPSCLNKECGDNGCGGMCGACPSGMTCKDGLCAPDQACTPSCTSKECGDNGCGGSCGTCGFGFWCNQGICLEGEAPPDVGSPETEDVSEQPQADGVGGQGDTGTPGLPPGQCPPGQKWFFTKCVDDPGAQPEDEAGSGCSASAHPMGAHLPATIMLLLLCVLAAAAARAFPSRRSQNTP